MSIAEDMFQEPDLSKNAVSYDRLVPATTSKLSPKQIAVLVTTAVLIFFLFFFVLNNGYFYLSAVYNLLSPFISQFWINLCGVVSVLVLGVALYWFRLRKRIHYGIVEVTFALASAWYGINKIATTGYAESITVIAAVYLVVRGVDNIREGFINADKEDADTLARALDIQRIAKTTP